MATKNWRICVMIPKELQTALEDLRKIPEYKGMTYSKLVKTMVEKGLQAKNDTGAEA